MNLYAFFKTSLKTLRSFVREFNAHPTVKIFNSVVCKFQAYHQKGYAFLMQLPSYVAYVSIPILVLFYLVVIVPTAVWLLFGLATGDFSMGLGYSIWEASWVVWEACKDSLVACGQYAACEQCHKTSYTITFFYLLSCDQPVLRFHVLMACFLSFTTMYQASLFLNFLKRKPTFKMVSYISFLLGLLAYMLALWILGLSSNVGPGNSVGFPLLCILGLFILHALWWLIQAFRCERLAVGILLILLLIGVILHSVAYLWPIVNAFEFYGLWRSWVDRKLKRFFSTMAPWWPKKEDEPLSPRSACTRDHKESSEAATSDYDSGKATADETVERLKKNNQSLHNCHKQVANWEASKALKRKLLKDEQLADAKHEGKLEQSKNPANLGKVVENISEVLVNVTGGKRGQDKGQDKTPSKTDEKTTK